MPFLEKETTQEEAIDKKYVWVFNKIYFADPFDGDQVSHGDLVRKAAQKLGVILQDIKRDDRGKPMVEAAGKIAIVDGKFSFSIMTSTCNIVYSAEDALKSVTNFASELLGEDRIK